MSSAELSYIENSSWDQFLHDFGAFFESEFEDDNPLRVIFDNSATVSLNDLTIGVIEKALALEERPLDAYPQKLLDDFCRSCIRRNRYIMNCHSFVESIIRYLMDKGAVVSPDLIIGVPIGSALEDLGQTFTIRAFIYHKFLQNTIPISYSAVHWEDALNNAVEKNNCRYSDVMVTEENFLGAILYEVQNLSKLYYI